MAKKKIGIFYGSSTGQTEAVAEKLQRILGEEDSDVINVDNATTEDLERYQYLIFGTSTWGFGDMQDDWDDFMEVVLDADLKDKKIALFGLGDQDTYPESFADGVGVLYSKIKGKSNIIGEWPNSGYVFDDSDALQGKKFVGLIIDQENQASKTEERLEKWAEMIRKEFR